MPYSSADLAFQRRAAAQSLKLVKSEGSSNLTIGFVEDPNHEDVR